MSFIAQHWDTIVLIVTNVMALFAPQVKVTTKKGE